MKSLDIHTLIMAKLAWAGRPNMFDYSHRLWQKDEDSIEGNTSIKHYGVNQYEKT